MLPTLRDYPIAAATVAYLDSNISWSATSGETVILASVPGDLVTDLQNAKIIADPLYELTFLANASWWAEPRNWTYSTIFSLPAAAPGTSQLLVFDGIKMGARILVNGLLVGIATNQFVRLVFPLL